MLLLFRRLPECLRGVSRTLPTYTRSYSLSHMPRATRWVAGNYPRTRRADNIDKYKSTRLGEVSVPDPYQHLEDHDSPETDQFTTIQAAFTRQYLDQNPELPRLEKAFNDCNNYPKVCGRIVLSASSDHARRVCFSFMHPNFATTEDTIGSITVVWTPRQVNWFVASKISFPPMISVLSRSFLSLKGLFPA